MRKTYAYPTVKKVRDYLF